MTSKLKCPFCQQELIREGMNHWWCSCNIEHQGKELYGTTALWQALIQAKQDLKIAKSYVKGVSKMVINSGDNIYIVIGYFKKLAEQTLEQIEHKGQQCQI